MRKSAILLFALLLPHIAFAETLIFDLSGQNGHHWRVECSNGTVYEGQVGTEDLIIYGVPMWVLMSKGEINSTMIQNEELPLDSTLSLSEVIDEWH